MKEQVRNPWYFTLLGLLCIFGGVNWALEFKEHGYVTVGLSTASDFGLLAILVIFVTLGFWVFLVIFGIRSWVKNRKADSG
jgi:hypothetical protein